MKHKFVLARKTSEFAEWECPKCSRYVRLGSDGSGLTILNPGDQSANHGAATTFAGLELGGASVDSSAMH